MTVDLTSIAQSSWGSYPSVLAMGHKGLQELLLDPVIVQEKIDGSQISFGRFADPTDVGKTILRIRSKGAEINQYAPEGMFKKAVVYIQQLAATERLRPGWTYRGEYLDKPKHNALAYERVPKNNIILFDVNSAYQEYLDYEDVQTEATVLDLETVPLLYRGTITNAETIRNFLNLTSVLGGQKIEGVVIKNYIRFGLDKKCLLGKFVSEEFKEVHSAEWKEQNPGQTEIVERLIRQYRTPARWNKAIQHLNEAGTLQHMPQDIPLILREVGTDIEKEEIEAIKDALYKWAWPKIARGVNAGLPEFYKEQLLKAQFEPGTPERDLLDPVTTNG